MRSTNSAARDHAAIAHKYALDVVAGRVAAGALVRGAAQRQLDDLRRPRSWPYVYDPAKGARVCRFVELLPHTKGRWAAAHELLVLQPWQCFVICCIFGWVRKKSGKRRFRVAYLEVPRKNGKSLTFAAIGLYMLAADGEYGAEVYSGATTEKQAYEIFRPARMMAQRTDALSDALGVAVWAKALVVEKNGSRFEPLIGNPGDGASPSCAIVDEYHEHQTPALYDTMETGMGAREQPLMLVITTAGTNIAGPCHDKHEEVRKLLTGVEANDELWGCIYGLDPEDDWVDPKSLDKANPNIGISVDRDFLLSQQRQAMANPLQQSRFRTKHLNVWTSVYAGVMNMLQWTRCADLLLDEDELAADPDADLYVGVDLASKSDLCSEQRLYRRIIEGEPHYYLFGRYWLPEAAVEEAGPNSAAYRKWVVQGLLTQTEGATVDFAGITEQVVDDCKRLRAREAVFDPFNAVQMMQAAMADGIVAVEFVQTPQAFAVPLDELVTAVKDGRFHHDGNPITNWCMSNMVARPAKKGLVSPIKAKPHQKIDGAVAAIMAVARACATDRARKPEYQIMTF